MHFAFKDPDIGNKKLAFDVDPGLQNYIFNCNIDLLS